MKKGMTTTFRLGIDFLLIVGIVFFARYVYYFTYGVFSNEPYDSEQTWKLEVEVTDHDTIDTIGDELERLHIIGNKKQMKLRYKLSEYRDKIQPGEYELGPEMGYDDILSMITGQTETTQ